MQARRDELKTVGVCATTHAGLWWDKYLKEQGDKNDPHKKLAGARAQHIKSLEPIRIPAGYDEAFQRWKALLELHPDTFLARAEAIGRVVIGIGDRGAMEVGLRLHHTWGVPYLPGSSLKGVAAAAAHKLLEDSRWRRDEGRGDLHRFLFGSTDEAGAVEFEDALWIPGLVSRKLPIHLDVMTVHHDDYYQKGDLPSDTDSPNPISFASLRGQYLVAITARRGLWTSEDVAERDRWIDIALKLLKIGLESLGIGAKTNAGYGRMALKYETATAQRPPQPVQGMAAGSGKVWLGKQRKKAFLFMTLPGGETLEKGVRGAQRAEWCTVEMLKKLEGSSRTDQVLADVEVNANGRVTGLTILDKDQQPASVQSRWDRANL